MVVRRNDLTRQEHYSAWAFQRIFRRIAVYLFILPFLLVLWPLSALSNWLGLIFYKYQ